MKEAKQFFDQFKNGLLGGIATAALAKVEKYDPAGFADVSLEPDGELISNVPVATIQNADFFIRVPLKKGDIVAVMFSGRDIDGVMHEDPDSTTDRMLDINDAIIVGGINVFSAPLPAENKNDLVLAKKDMSTRVVIGANGNVTIDAAGKVFLGDGATEGVPLGAQLKTWLDNHTHDYDDDGSNKTTKKPSNPSPAPSKGVLVK